jgi:DNA-binding CsgD family transcriptional regulator
MSFATLIDEIYEAGVLPEKWPAVLDQLARIADAEGALLFAASPGTPIWLSSAAIRDRAAAWVASPWFLNDPRSERLVPIKEPRFLTDLDAFTIEELDQEAFYTSFLRPMGLGWVVGTSIRSPAGDALVITIEKSHAKGPVPSSVASELDLLRPHLARASLLSARIGLERARATVAAFETMGLPAVVMTSRRRALAANPAMSVYSSEIRIGARDEVQFVSPQAQAILTETIEHRQPPAGRSIPVPGVGGNAPFVAHVMPLRGAGLDVFTGAASLLYVTPLSQQSAPAGELLQALFDLTPAEARVAGLIAEGHAVETIGSILSVTPNTVRTQLKSIFTKTGVGRQAELASLLSASALRTQPWKPSGR